MIAQMIGDAAHRQTLYPRGARSWGHSRPTALYSVDHGMAAIRTIHDAVMRIAARLLGGGSILQAGTKARVGIGSPPPRISFQRSAGKRRLLAEPCDCCSFLIG